MKEKPLVDFIVGARPNFIKASAIFRALSQLKDKTFEARLIHTGQHYDYKMSGSFFEQLGLPTPALNLEAGSGSQAEQTAKVMIEYERLLNAKSPQLTVVFGDVNSTLACAISAAKHGVKVAHVEAGIRSSDLSMPEEINRIVTDSISNLFFTTSEQASCLLARAGHTESNIHFVGNTMVDTLLHFESFFKKPNWVTELSVSSGEFVLLTLHRPSNVDDPSVLRSLLYQCQKLTTQTNVLFPVHPRTLKTIRDYSIPTGEIILKDPLSYFEFGYLVKNSKMVITDSGGITEEATVWGTPCLTARHNTERPETVEIGSNILIGSDHEQIIKYFEVANRNMWKVGAIPKLWDGEAGTRIVKIINKELKSQ